MPHGINTYYQIKQVCQFNQYWCLPVSLLAWSLGGGGNKKKGGRVGGAQPCCPGISWGECKKKIID